MKAKMIEPEKEISAVASNGGGDPKRFEKWPLIRQRRRRRDMTENETLLLMRNSQKPLKEQFSARMGDAKEGFTFKVVNDDLIRNPIL